MHKCQITDSDQFVSCSVWRYLNSTMEFSDIQNFKFIFYCLGELDFEKQTDQLSRKKIEIGINVTGK